MNNPAEIIRQCDEGIEYFTKLKTLATSALQFQQSVFELYGDRVARAPKLLARGDPNPPPNKRRSRRAKRQGKPATSPPAIIPTKAKRVVSEATRQRMREGQARRHQGKSVPSSPPAAEDTEPGGAALPPPAVDRPDDEEATAEAAIAPHASRRPSVTAEERRQAAAFDAHQREIHAERSEPASISKTFESRPRARRGDTGPINPMRMIARDETPTLASALDDEPACA
jgi:hypothetical protein